MAGSGFRRYAGRKEVACFHPQPAYRSTSGDVFFVERGHVAKEGYTPLELPCGQCIGCRLERSRQWAIRCMHEKQLHERACFLTLTYKVDPVSLQYRDFQLFMKRLRARLKGAKLRFFMCGEYGERFSRPHFHCCLYGWDFPDRQVFSQGQNPLYRSALLEECWPHGFASIGELTFESAAYVARYVMKKVTGPNAREHYGEIGTDPNTGEVLLRQPEFTHMSLKPGIGAGWLDKFASDVYPHGKVVVNGVECKPPRYYDVRFKKSGLKKYSDGTVVPSIEYEDMMFERDVAANARAADNTYSRLAVREQVTKARVKLKKRNQFGE